MTTQPALTPSLTEPERATLRAAMDRLVPAVDDLPGAGTMGLVAAVEAMAARYAPFHAAVVRLVTEIGVDVFPALTGPAQDAAITAFEQAQPVTFATALDVVYLAYYADARVHARIGWRTGPLQPRGFAVPPFDDAILEQARKRAPFWRQAPK
jgi:hypothetical protein